MIVGGIVLASWVAFSSSQINSVAGISLVLKELQFVVIDNGTLSPIPENGSGTRCEKKGEKNLCTIWIVRAMLRLQ